VGLDRERRVDARERFTAPEQHRRHRRDLLGPDDRDDVQSPGPAAERRSAHAGYRHHHERRGDLYRRAEEGHGAWRLRARRHQRDDAAREPQVLARNRHQSGRDRPDRTHHPQSPPVAPSEPPSRADRAYAELTGTPSLAVTRRRLPVGKLLRELRGARPLTRGAAASSPRDLGPWAASRRLSHAALVPPSTGITVPVTKD